MNDERMLLLILILMLMIENSQGAFKDSYITMKDTPMAAKEVLPSTPQAYLIDVLLPCSSIAGPLHSGAI